MANRQSAVENALYLYGVSPAGGTSKISSTGIDGLHPVEGLDCGDFTCWVSAVDPAKFARELETNLENLDWLALHGVRHQQVVGEIAGQTTIIPARFGTVFSGTAALFKDVQSRKAALSKTLKKVTDSEEWGVKVFAERKAAPPVTAEARSGRDYLKQKASQLKARPEKDEGPIRELAEALEKVATDSAPTGKISGTQPELVWQATFLVARKRRKEWDNVLQEFVDRWGGQRRIEVNGPWPPYSFVSDAD
jgi:hypothetical protein